MANAVAAPPRTFIGTVFAVCTPERIDETRAALHSLRDRSALRTLVVSLGEASEPPIHDEDGATVIEGLTPRYLNNVVAARRLSSLPAAAWWRVGKDTDRGILRDLAPLVDRVILDSIDPTEDWRATVGLFDLTAFGDLRWTRLTRWRSLMAQFFDVPAVRADAGSFEALEIEAPDEQAARLFAAWLTARLPAGAHLRVSIRPSGGGQALTLVRLSSPRNRLEIGVTSNGTCVKTSIEGGPAPATRTVSLGDQSLAAQLEGELRVRARDPRFEEALRLVERPV